MSLPRKIEQREYDKFREAPNGYAGIETLPALVNTPLTGQAKIAVTGTAVQLPANTLFNGVILTAYSLNAAPVTIGGSGVTNTIDGTGNGTILEASTSLSFAVSDTSNLWINGTAGDIVSFSGS